MSVQACAAAFFPWVATREPITLGTSVRLLPFQVGRLPGDLPQATQADLDGILGAYSDRPGVPVRCATIVEVDNWYTGIEDSSVRPRLFRARTAIGFAALAKRRLFESHLGYCCYDTYSLVVQRYKAAETGMFSFTTRRRDGSAGHLWGSDQFAFRRPLHVDERAPVDFDQKLAQTLIEIPDDASKDLFEALSEFNSANTDSQDVPPHVEVVMTKSAFEWLLGINQDANEFVRELQKCLPDPDIVDDGPLKEAWRKRFPKARRPIEAWAREFCDLRGASAHGRNRDPSRFVWKRHVHLAFASVLFPLIVKAKLAQAGNWTTTNSDAYKLARIESYLIHDPFMHDSTATSESNPWSDLDSEAFIAQSAKKLWPGGSD